MPTREQPKQPKRDRSLRSDDETADARDDESEESQERSRGDALTSGGNKIHGDELEGIIPGRASQPDTGKQPK